MTLSIFGSFGFRNHQLGEGWRHDWAPRLMGYTKPQVIILWDGVVHTVL